MSTSSTTNHTTTTSKPQSVLLNINFLSRIITFVPVKADQTQIYLSLQPQLPHALFDFHKQTFVNMITFAMVCNVWDETIRCYSNRMWNLFGERKVMLQPHTTFWSHYCYYQPYEEDPMVSDDELEEDDDVEFQKRCSAPEAQKKILETELHLHPTTKNIDLQKLTRPLTSFHDDKSLYYFSPINRILRYCIMSHLRFASRLLLDIGADFKPYIWQWILCHEPKNAGDKRFDNWRVLSQPSDIKEKNEATYLATIDFIEFLVYEIDDFDINYIPPRHHMSGGNDTTIVAGHGLVHLAALEAHSKVPDRWNEVAPSTMLLDLLYSRFGSVAIIESRLATLYKDRDKEQYNRAKIKLATHSEKIILNFFPMSGRWHGIKTNDPFGREKIEANPPRFLWGRNRILMQNVASPFMRAIMAGRHEVVKWFLEKFPHESVLDEMPRLCGYTPLEMITGDGSCEVRQFVDDENDDDEQESCQEEEEEEEEYDEETDEERCDRRIAQREMKKRAIVREKVDKLASYINPRLPWKPLTVAAMCFRLSMLQDPESLFISSTSRHHELSLYHRTPDPAAGHVSPGSYTSPTIVPFIILPSTQKLAYRETMHALMQFRLPQPSPPKAKQQKSSPFLTTFRDMKTILADSIPKSSPSSPEFCLAAQQFLLLLESPWYFDLSLVGDLDYGKGEGQCPTSETFEIVNRDRIIESAVDCFDMCELVNVLAKESPSIKERLNRLEPALLKSLKDRVPPPKIDHRFAGVAAQIEQAKKSPFGTANPRLIPPQKNVLLSSSSLSSSSSPSKRMTASSSSSSPTSANTKRLAPRKASTMSTSIVKNGSPHHNKSNAPPDFGLSISGVSLSKKK